MASTNTGAFLGGVAGARDRRQTRELEGRRLDIVESQFKAEQQAELLQSVRDRLAGLTEQAVGLIKNIAIGRDDPKFHEAIRPLREAVATLSARASENFPGAIDPQSQAALFDSAVSSTPTMSEKAQAEAMAVLEGAKTTGEGLAGASETTLIAAGLAAPPRSDTLQNQMLEAAAAGRSLPATRPIVVNPGDIVISPDGSVLFKAPGGTGGRPLVVNPGDTAITPEGEVLFQSPEKPPTDPETIRLQEERDTAERNGDFRQAQELTDIINKRGTVVGRTEQDLASATGFETALTTPTEGDIERLRTNIRENQSGFETASNTLKAVQDAGALSVGFVGAGVESFSGIMGNLGVMGDAIKAGLESVTGADLEKLTAARVSMREGVGSALKEITEEEGSRYTDTEREIAGEVLRGLTPDSDIDQVVAAYSQYFRILNASDVRNAREIIRGAKIDLGTSGALNPGGVEEIGTLLRSLGMGEDRIIEILDQVVPR